MVGLPDLESGQDALTELLRGSARQLISQAVEAEFQELLSGYADRRTEDGKAAVVRNRHAQVLDGKGRAGTS